MASAMPASTWARLARRSESSIVRSGAPARTVCPSWTWTLRTQPIMRVLTSARASAATEPVAVTTSRGGHLVCGDERRADLAGGRGFGAVLAGAAGGEAGQDEHGNGQRDGGATEAGS